MPDNHKKKTRHVSPPAAAREAAAASPASATPTASDRGSGGSTSHRRDLLDGSIQEVSRKTLMERFRKRGRVESANYEQHSHLDVDGPSQMSATVLQANGSSFANTADGAAPVLLRAGRAPHHAPFVLHKNTPARARSAPDLTEKVAKSADEKPAKQQQSGVLLSQAAKTDPLRSSLPSQPVRERVNVPAPLPTAAATGTSNGYHHSGGTQYFDTVDTDANELDSEIDTITSQLSLEEKHAHPPAPSPYIVSFYDAFVDRPKNSICMVMEYMSTGSLQDIVLHGGCQNEKVLARLASGVVHGLAHIHKKRMVHRDIKPHNLLTNRQGEVKISDFGLARTLNDTSTQTKTFVGTLLYMAPERIGGGDYSYPGMCELESLGDAVYRHMYERSVKFSHQPQVGPLSFVYGKRCHYSDKLLEDYCYSPQSWTASPGIARRQQFGIGSESPQRVPSDRGSFWRKLQDSMAKLGHSKRKKKERERSSSKV
ncbi:hypothetical protein BBJ28_00019898 [Nothophytophthora sp. Chile5]|nr:hypothetical protein BBJ28_00019898 [Nothophytophthora sp. Chile5]